MTSQNTTDAKSACLERLVSRESELVEELEKVREQIRGERLKKAQDEHGIFIGCVVTYRDNEYRVTNIETSGWMGKPWLIGNPRLKSGKFGTAERHLYGDWSLSTNTTVTECGGKAPPAVTPPDHPTR